MVKKKAALTLLRLYRKHPDVIPAAEWAMRIVAIMDDIDLVCLFLFIEPLFCVNSIQGVVNSVTSLVMALAQDHLDVYAVCYQKAVNRLYKVGSPLEILLPSS